MPRRIKAILSNNWMGIALIAVFTLDYYFHSSILSRPFAWADEARVVFGALRQHILPFTGSGVSAIDNFFFIILREEYPFIWLWHYISTGFLSMLHLPVSEFSIRSLSAGLYYIDVFLVYRLGRNFFNKYVGFIASFCFLFDPMAKLFLFFYSLHFPLLFLAILLSLIYAKKYVEDPKGANLFILSLSIFILTGICSVYPLFYLIVFYASYLTKGYRRSLFFNRRFMLFSLPTLLLICFQGLQALIWIFAKIFLHKVYGFGFLAFNLSGGRLNPGMFVNLRKFIELNLLNFSAFFLLCLLIIFAFSASRILRSKSYIRVFVYWLLIFIFMHFLIRASIASILYYSVALYLLAGYLFYQELYLSFLKPRIKGKSGLIALVLLFFVFFAFRCQWLRGSTYYREAVQESVNKDFTALKTVGYFLREYGRKGGRVFNVVYGPPNSLTSEYYYNKQCTDAKNRGREIFFASENAAYPVALKGYPAYWGFKDYDYIVIFNSALAHSGQAVIRDIFAFMESNHYLKAAEVVDAGLPIASIYCPDRNHSRCLILDRQAYDKKFDRQFGKLSELITNKNIGLFNFGGWEKTF